MHRRLALRQAVTAVKTRYGADVNNFRCLIRTFPVMSDGPFFNEQTAHRRFAADCFNRAWDLIEKAERTREEDQEMVRLTLASHWHWTQVKDHTPQNISIAYWQTARIFALLEDAGNAMQYAVRQQSSTLPAMIPSVSWELEIG